MRINGPAAKCLQERWLAVREGKEVKGLKWSGGKESKGGKIDDRDCRGRFELEENGAGVNSPGVRSRVSTASPSSYGGHYAFSIR